jgi:small-conductance mechanosensitive channel
MEFKEQVKKGFQACKDDIETLFEDNKDLTSSLQQLSSENISLKSEVQELKLLLNSFKEEFSLIGQELKEIRQQKQIVQTVPVHTQPQVQPQQVDSLYSQQIPTQQPIQPLPQPSVDPYEALLAFKAKSNKRDMLKQKMMSLVGDQGMNLSELKFMIVDHFRYCSKATFYNYLKELELEHHIKIERSHSKNIVFLSSMKREI